jgi:hypothetical protein
MSRERGPVVPLEQRCIEPGHWVIEGRHVRANYQGRSRKILGWDVETLPGEVGQSPFATLASVREWIREQASS